jgi:predicted dehydrogenase
MIGKRIKVGVVGAGRMAELIHLRSLVEMPQVERTIPDQAYKRVIAL